MLKKIIEAVYQDGDSATKRYYEELRGHKFMTTKCKNCKNLFFPPRIICPECLSLDVEWVELSGKGKLYAFTQQEVALLFAPPDVIGIVELEDGCGKILARIDAQYDKLHLGMPVSISFIDLPDFTLPQFTPIESN